ncbi:hypothetical protein QCA50_015054 [Cerrena zonata]|uniref:Uncharacterized protein n=1 Tax=Cerrena zonata TaxID=2478898 RepID=A0AAW0FR02_9APHY
MSTFWTPPPRIRDSVYSLSEATPFRPPRRNRILAQSVQDVSKHHDFAKNWPLLHHRSRAMIGTLFSVRLYPALTLAVNTIIAHVRRNEGTVKYPHLEGV